MRKIEFIACLLLFILSTILADFFKVDRLMCMLFSLLGFMISEVIIVLIVNYFKNKKDV